VYISVYAGFSYKYLCTKLEGIKVIYI
jgi:hypothetical protein